MKSQAGGGKGHEAQTLVTRVLSTVSMLSLHTSGDGELNHFICLWTDYWRLLPNIPLTSASLGLHVLSFKATKNECLFPRKFFRGLKMVTTALGLSTPPHPTRGLLSHYLIPQSH